MIYLSYLLGNLAVLRARLKGCPRQRPLKLGGWGTIINVLALVWGGSMIVNFLWPVPQNPALSALPTSPGSLGNIPIFEATLAIIVIVEPSTISRCSGTSPRRANASCVKYSARDEAAASRPLLFLSEQVAPVDGRAGQASRGAMVGAQSARWEAALGWLDRSAWPGVAAADQRQRASGRGPTVVAAGGR